MDLYGKYYQTFLKKKYFFHRRGIMRTKPLILIKKKGLKKHWEKIKLYLFESTLKYHHSDILHERPWGKKVKILKHLRCVCRRKSTRRSMSGVETVFNIYFGFTNQIVRTNHIVIINCYRQHVFHWNDRFEIKHSRIDVFCVMSEHCN